MVLSDLSKHPLIYVASPYSRFERGLEEAFREVCCVTAVLIDQGIGAYSPIAHTHPIAVHGGLDPLDHSKWMKFDAIMMQKSDALVVAMMDGWETSKGIQQEIQTFLDADKPVYFLDVSTLKIEAASDSGRKAVRAA